MNVNDFMAKHGITEADLERMAAPMKMAALSLSQTAKYLSARISIQSALAARRWLTMRRIFRGLY